MNPLYNMIMKQSQPMNNQMNPFQKFQAVMSAMSNPAGYVKNAFPDIPQEIQNNPNQILQYLQQTRNISNGQIQQLMQQIPKF